MIINPRGTSGAGKSTFAFRLAALYLDLAEPTYIDGRKAPLYTRYDRPKGRKGPPLFLLGHYNTACGGCDTLKNTEQAFELARRLAPEGDVLLEGILISEEFNRSKACHEFMSSEFADERFIVYALDTPIEQCIANIKKRRVEKGDIRELNTSNTENRVARINSATRRLIEAGADVRSGSFDWCLADARSLLKI